MKAGCLIKYIKLSIIALLVVVALFLVLSPATEHCDLDDLVEQCDCPCHNT